MDKTKEEIQSDLDSALERYKMKCCKTSRTSCCMNLIPVWSSADIEIIKTCRSKLKELK